MHLIWPLLVTQSATRAAKLHPYNKLRCVWRRAERHGTLSDFPRQSCVGRAPCCSCKWYILPSFWRTRLLHVASDRCGSSAHMRRSVLAPLCVSCAWTHMCVSCAWRSFFRCLIDIQTQMLFVFTYSIDRHKQTSSEFIATRTRRETH